MSPRSTLRGHPMNNAMRSYRRELKMLRKQEEAEQARKAKAIAAKAIIARHQLQRARAAERLDARKPAKSAREALASPRRPSRAIYGKGTPQHARAVSLLGQVLSSPVPVGKAKATKLAILKRPPPPEHDPLTVTVYYQALHQEIPWTTIDAMLRLAARAYSGKVMGSGTTLATGMRDVEYRFRDRCYAQWFKDLVLRVMKLPKLKATIG